MKFKIDAVKMVRKIRDQQSAETAGKSTQDIIGYFRKKAERISVKTKSLELKRR